MMKFIGVFVLFLLLSVAAVAQDSVQAVYPKGKLYGQVFGDFFYKAHADSFNRGYNQYAKIPQNSNGFQIRRVQLGYKYNFNTRFSANILLEAVQQGQDLTPFIKYANIRWKDIFPGSDLVVGRMKTLTFSTVTDKVWSYRAVEKSITDMHGSPSSDFGVALWGRLNRQGSLGYNVMIGNGEGALEDKYKKFYGEVYAKLWDKRLVFDLYADYEKLQPQAGYRQSSSMLKAFAAYEIPKLTVGVEAYRRHFQNGAENEMMEAVDVDNYGISIFARGKFKGDKLGYFARLDYLLPTVPDKYKSEDLLGLIPEQNPAYRRRFITAGLDYEPFENIHFIPNIWYCGYEDRLSGRPDDYDLVYRLTFFYTFGK